MKKIIFLDIDGVMASVDFLCKSEIDGVPRDQIPGEGFVDPEKVKLLNKLKGDGVEIVISSTWGTSVITPLLELGCEIPIVGNTKRIMFEWSCRGSEIDEYVINNFGQSTKWGCDIEGLEYVIIDDSCDMLLGQAEHFVKIDPVEGITEKDIEKIKNILKL